MTSAATVAQATYSGKLEISFPSDLEIQATRVFDAPPELVFEAMTSPQHIPNWWGPRETRLESCELDFRVGGGWRYVMSACGGQAFGFHGEFREIVPGRRIVQTFVFEPIPEAAAVETLEFEALEGGRTRLTATVLHSSKEHRDGHFNAGMEQGLRESWQRLEELLADLRRG